MPDNRCRDVLGLGQPLFSFSLRIPKPRNVEIVVASGDRIATEPAPAAFLALILALSRVIGIIAVRRLETCKVCDSQRARLAESGHVGAYVIDPHSLGVGFVRVAALKKQNVRLHALRVEDARRQTEDGMQVAKVHQPRAEAATRVVLEQYVVGDYHCGTSGWFQRADDVLDER